MLACVRVYIYIFLIPKNLNCLCSKMFFLSPLCLLAFEFSPFAFADCSLFSNHIHPATVVLGVIALEACVHGPVT